MVILLVILAILALVIGFFTLSQATMGVGILAAACLFGILARIAQAAQHQTELKTLLNMQASLPRPMPPQR
jgi:hypothetical protein